jgi:hypothetical protein
MKTKLTQNTYEKFALSAILFFILTACISCSVAESIPLTDAKTGKASRKERDVKIYPDIVKRVMHIKSVEAQPLDFFVFNTEGALKLHYKMQDGDRKKKVTGLERGMYVYQVFKGDEMTEAGRITIK